MDPGKFVNATLATSVPWSDLVQQGHLQSILLAIVQRLDRFDRVLANNASGSSGGSGSTSGGGGGGDTGGPLLAVVPSEDLQKFRDRIDILENITFQNRVESLQHHPPTTTSSSTTKQQAGTPSSSSSSSSTAAAPSSSLSAIATDAKKKFNLANHVIPLTQLKGKVDAFEIGLQSSAQQIDETNMRLAKLAEAFQSQFDQLLKDLRLLESKHEALARRVEEIAKELFEQITKKIQELQKQLDSVTERMNQTEAKVQSCFDYIDRVDRSVSVLSQRLLPIEEQMPLKADKSYVDSSIQQIRDEIAKLNIEEVMAMAKRANERIDLMDLRCDKMEDETAELKKFVQNFAKELEDQQLQRQIDILKRELEEAKTGVFVKATERMDTMQKETNDLRSSLTTTQGHVQVTRESVQQIEEYIRERGANITTMLEAPNGEVPSGPGAGSTKALIAQLQQEVAALQERFNQVSEILNDGKQRAALDTIDEIMAKLEVLDQTKVDRDVVRTALEEKADKELVARETELNQRAVDEALRSMNAGTQGIQQLLERQEGAVSQLFDKLSAKPDREELEHLEEELRRARTAPDPQAALNAVYTRYGVNVDDAAGMRRPLQRNNCISCSRPIQSEPQNAMPSLPLLPPTNKNVSYVPRRASQSTVSWNGDTMVETRDLGTIRSAGGAYTNMRIPRRPKSPDGSSPDANGRTRSVELLGEDGKVYHGRLRSAGGTMRSPSVQRP